MVPWAWWVAWTWRGTVSVGMVLQAWAWNSRRGCGVVSGVVGVVGGVGVVPWWVACGGWRVVGGVVSGTMTMTTHM
jgi:hypothetical protein